MNAEYLLDAIGRLDDDLVREAERYRRPRARYGPMLGWAASFALVIALGYVLTHVGGMGGGNGAAPSFSGGGNSMAPASGNSVPSGDEDNAGVSGDSGKVFEPETPGESAPSSLEDQAGNAQLALPGTVFVRGAQGSGAYILTGEVLAKPPEGVELLGKLLALYPDSPSPYTTVEEYVGLNLWAEKDGTDLPPAVYVELPGGGFAEAVLTQP